jgi:hypothetical protein
VLYASLQIALVSNCPFHMVEFHYEERARAAIEKAKLLQLPKQQRPLSGELDQNTHIPHSL